MKVTAVILIVAGVLVALSKVGLTLGVWWTPVILIGLGLASLLFPAQLREWRQQRAEERMARRAGR